jgi:hypothetical protein
VASGYWKAWTLLVLEGPATSHGFCGILPLWVGSLTRVVADIGRERGIRREDVAAGLSRQPRLGRQACGYAKGSAVTSPLR